MCQEVAALRYRSRFDTFVTMFYARLIVCQQHFLLREFVQLSRDLSFRLTYLGATLQRDEIKVSEQ